MTDTWWNIILYPQGRPMKARVKKIDGVWMYRFSFQESAGTVRDCKSWMKRNGYIVRSYPNPLPCRCRRNSRDIPSCKNPKNRFYGRCYGGGHRELWSDRMAVGEYGRGGIRMVADLVEKGDWA
tara:strand:+ start:883 stop:1254 length:372 start_codon:yes stop_codon:yes gene_type:complete